ncbi:hypothetical protein C8R43DRAFT_962648 [Mycena crocata]|nr:hypothetical protein C8R43DRAFT_962648 [Mycena crocata]
MTLTGGAWWFTITLICWAFPSSFVQAYPHTRQNGRRDALLDDGLSSASWIWTAEPTAGNVAFVRTFSSTAGKVATSATISMTAVHYFTLWINGQPIGASSGNGADDWTNVRIFSVALNASTNTFSVLTAYNPVSGAPPPGFLAEIQVQYGDGSSDALVSDPSWDVSAGIPSEFPTLVNISGFVPATVVGSFGAASWGNVSVPALPTSAGSDILLGSTWIWNTSTAGSGAPTGTVGFRKTVTTPPGKSAQSAQLIIGADNAFLLYVNGQYIGAPPPAPMIPDFKRAQRVTVDLRTASNTFTIFGKNIPDPGTTDAGPAGIVAKITIQYSDGSSDVVGTDTSWLSGAFTTVPAFLTLTDTSLSPTFAIRTEAAGFLTGVSDLLAAPRVPIGPFASGTALPTPPGGNGNEVKNKGGVPVGAIVGAVVGVLVLIGVGVVLFFWLRRRRSLRARALSSQSFGPTGLSMPPNNGQPIQLHAAADISSITSQSLTSQPYPNPWSEPGATTTVQPVNIPPSKLARERIWQNNAGPSRSASSSEGSLPAPPSYYDYAQ